MRAAKVQASLRICAVSPEPPLLAHTSSESSGTFRQKARSLAPLNGWAWAVKICKDGMLEDTNSLDGAHLMNVLVCFISAIMILSFRRDRAGQTVKILIRLLVQEWSDQTSSLGAFHILSTAITYSCVIAAKHFLNGPHTDVYISISKCLRYLNKSAHRLYVE